ncbi:hypothetical protein B0I35DRAFT_477300 [Stachybotrys elegans]|uniref:Glucose-methanol-choline oxidoreductase N-terminal domain-containing protein n=1 Tax=Stachybotrys elegans TaxID=80388 RepID=A0A8K0SYY2_9HYPO|nr:hypothetical protein B0I35DRAFT_477300 [Stachybotrys elegans]
MSLALQSYDFIVAGGGTAGLVVANRLSENPNHTVLVLEAGPDLINDSRVQTPAFYTTLMGSEADWAFVTVPQTELENRTVSLNQGRALGGSTAINGQILVPPTQGLLDTWAALGNTGWNWKSLRSYFSKAFSAVKYDSADAVMLGVDGLKSTSPPLAGPVEVSFPFNQSHPIREAWANTFRDMNYYMADNPYFDATIGSFSNLVTTSAESGQRSYANPAYYQPVKSRSNLQVLTGATVKKILFADSGKLKKAIGVNFLLNGKETVAYPKREVILAAGALQSPKLLELSGVGNATLLKKFGIPVVKDLPAVGENLKDHMVCGISYEVQDDIPTLDALARGETNALVEAMNMYAQNKTGPLTSIGLTTYSYLPVIDYLTERGRNLLLDLLNKWRPHWQAGYANARDRLYYSVMEKYLNDPKQASAAFFTVTAQTPLPVGDDTESPAGNIAGKFLTIGSILSAPLSHGTVHISSADVKDAPIVDPRYLSHPVDVEIFGRHMQYIETIAASAGLKSILKQPLNRRDPVSHLETLEQAKAYAKRSSISMWHLGGSNSMLPEASGGVVDTNLKVYGFTNLRVVDSSAIPLISTANLQATVYMFAERAADIIKKANP